jgi:hypothetical protein
MQGGYWVECTYPDGTIALINLNRVVAIECYEKGAMIRFSRAEGDNLIVVEAPYDVLKMKPVAMGEAQTDGCRDRS